MKLYRLWIVLVIAILALAACGSDDEDNNNSDNKSGDTAASNDADANDQDDNSTQTPTEMPFGLPVTLEHTLGQGQATNVVWTADSTAVAITGTAGVWLYENGEAHFFNGLREWTGALAFEEGTSRVVSTSTGNQRDLTFDFISTVQVWNRDTFELGAQMQPDEGIILTLDFSPDGTNVAGGGTDTKLYIWDAATGDRVEVFEDHGGSLRALAYNTDGTLLATGSNDGMVRIFNLAMGEATVLEGHAENVIGVLFLENDTQLLTLDSERTAIIWDIASGEQVNSFEYPCSVSTCDFILTDEGQLLTHTGEYTNFVDMETGEHTDGKSGVFSPDGSTYVRRDEGRIEVVEVASGDALYEGDYVAIYTDLESYGNLLAAAPTSPHANIRLFDIDTLDYAVLEASSTYDYRPMAFSPDGTLLASIQARNTAVVYNLEGETQQLLETPNFVFDVAFSPDGRLLVAANREEENALITRVWNTEDYSEAAALDHEHLGEDNWQGHADAIFSPDGSRLITIYGFTSSVLSVWDTETFELLNSVELDRAEVGTMGDMAFTPDGATLVVVGGTGSSGRFGDTITRGGRVLFLNGETLEIEQTFDNMVHEFNVEAVDISADGTHMITIGTTTPSGAVWDLETRTMLATFKLPRPGEDAVFLGDSNTRFATVGEDRAVSIWRLEEE